jgi:hypothetical protein
MDSIDLVFSFDTTGSMYSCLGEVRRVVDETTKRLFRDIPEIRIGVIAHGDYCDVGRTISKTELTGDAATVSRFIKGAPATGGGDFPECYELVLHQARAFNWSFGRNKTVVMIGDALPHTPRERQNTQSLDWRNEVRLLTEAGITVHAVQCLNWGTEAFWAELAKLGRGHHLRLSQFRNIVDLIMAVAYHQADQFHGIERYVDEYEREVDEHGRMTRELAAIFDKLKGRRGTSTKAANFKASRRETGLKPVNPGRFQVLSVPNDATIRDFVEARGITFQPGRGFYELTKSVTVQPRKEVILENRRTGDMYTGVEARRLLGLPEGVNAQVNRSAVPSDFRAFVQSTSYTRKLLADTSFLYEVTK